MEPTCAETYFTHCVGSYSRVNISLMLASFNQIYVCWILFQSVLICFSGERIELVNLWIKRDFHFCCIIRSTWHSLEVQNWNLTIRCSLMSYLGHLLYGGAFIRPPPRRGYSQRIEIPTKLALKKEVIFFVELERPENNKIIIKVF